ncbi:hypothetical protein Ddc_16972 [Ditylenchus destructor]|nr:hypothetical protein Ddc_16972 [Ditylenchus destructor]
MFRRKKKYFIDNDIDKLIRLKIVPLKDFPDTKYSAKVSDLRPATPAQIASSVPADSSQKQIITKLFIVISEGIVYYETSDGHEHHYAPLSEDTALMLRESVLSNDGCRVAIQFYASDVAIPCLYRKTKDQPAKKFSSLKQFKTFAERIKSIASLWANATVTAYFGRFEKKRNDPLLQSEYRSELFSPDCSILKCKKLRVTLVDNWSSIITDVVGQCEDCELNLKEVSGNCELHDKLLDEVYNGEALQRTEVTLFIRNNNTLDDFKRKLKQLLSKPLQKCFKFGLYFYSTKFCLKRLQTEHGTLEAKTVKKANKHYSGCMIIELRATAS